MLDFQRAASQYIASYFPPQVTHLVYGSTGQRNCTCIAVCNLVAFRLVIVIEWVFDMSLQEQLFGAAIQPVYNPQDPLLANLDPQATLQENAAAVAALNVPSVEERTQAILAKNAEMKRQLALREAERENLALMQQLQQSQAPLLAKRPRVATQVRLVDVSLLLYEMEVMKNDFIVCFITVVNPVLDGVTILMNTFCFCGSVIAKCCNVACRGLVLYLKILRCVLFALFRSVD